MLSCLRTRTEWPDGHSRRSPFSTSTDSQEGHRSDNETSPRSAAPPSRPSSEPMPSRFNLTTPTRPPLRVQTARSASDGSLSVTLRRYISVARLILGTAAPVQARPDAYGGSGPHIATWGACDDLRKLAATFVTSPCRISPSVTLPRVVLAGHR
jgi:hypothetical protein